MKKIYLILLVSYIFYGSLLQVNANPLRGEKVRRAKKTEFPFVVSIGWKNFEGPIDKNHLCTGALITKKLVLTSAHCLENEKMTDLIVTTGSADKRDGEKHEIKSSKTFEDWAFENDMDILFEENDIAILTLTRPVEDSSIQPAKLNFGLERDLKGNSAKTAGWGVSNTGQIPRFMETTNLDIISYIECMERVKVAAGRRVIVPRNYLCTKADPYGLIQSGDSGGPLFINGDTIIGVNEATFPKGRLDFDSKLQNLHTAIVHYKDFILDIISHTQS